MRDSDPQYCTWLDGTAIVHTHATSNWEWNQSASVGGEGTELVAVDVDRVDLPSSSPLHGVSFPPSETSVRAHAQLRAGKSASPCLAVVPVRASQGGCKLI